MGTLGGHISPAPSHPCSPTTAHAPAEGKRKKKKPKLRVYAACPFWFRTPRGRDALASAPYSAEAPRNDPPAQSPFKNPGGAGCAGL